MGTNKKHNKRRRNLVERIGNLDVSIGELLVFIQESRPITECERQIINHHARDLNKVASALRDLSESNTNNEIKKLEKEPKSCGFCEFDEAEGTLLRQCRRCKA